MKRRVVGAALLALGTCLWLAGLTSAQPEKKGQRLTDQQFVKTASADNLAAIDLARLALKQSTNADVRKFAQRMIDDHSKANQELNRIANSKSLAVAAAMDKKHRALAGKLASLHGAEFDREYLKQVVDDHKEAIALFDREAKSGQDPAVKEFASKTLPTLREHLQMARKITGTEGKEETKAKGRPGGSK